MLELELRIVASSLDSFDGFAELLLHLIFGALHSVSHVVLVDSNRLDVGLHRFARALKNSVEDVEVQWNAKNLHHHAQHLHHLHSGFQIRNDFLEELAVFLKLVADVVSHLDFHRFVAVGTDKLQYVGFFRQLGDLLVCSA